METPDRKGLLLSGTRSQIIDLLRSEPRTVAELTDILHLTDSAVRSHLAALERASIVHRRGTRRGFRKPHVTYALTETGESLFPNAYGPLLCEFLIIVSERVPPGVLDDWLRELGHRLAAGYRTTVPGPVAQRLIRALQVLSDLGGRAETEEQDGRLVIRGDACPLAAAVACRPEVCHVAETMLSDILGFPVHEHCDRGENPRCRFDLGPVEEQETAQGAK